jgi:hypothetical protein
MSEVIIRYNFGLKIFVNFCAHPVLFLKPCIHIRILEVAVLELAVVQSFLSFIHNYFLLIILQQNIDIIKVENYVDVLSEEDFIGMKTEEIYIPSSFSIRKAEPKVSHVVSYSFGGFSYMCVWCHCLGGEGSCQYKAFII